MTVTIMAFILSGRMIQPHSWPEETKNDTPPVASAPPNCTTTQNSDGTINTVCSH